MRICRWQKHDLTTQTSLLMDRAYEGDRTRTFVIDLGYMPVVPQRRIAGSLGIRIMRYARGESKSRGYFGV